jgi:hypothetical protein
MHLVMTLVLGHGSQPCSTTACKAPFSFERGEPS